MNHLAESAPILVAPSILYCCWLFDPSSALNARSISSKELVHRYLVARAIDRMLGLSILLICVDRCAEPLDARQYL
jgi:hypothetical protein